MKTADNSRAAASANALARAKPQWDVLATTDPAQLGAFYDRAIADPQYKGVRVLGGVPAAQAAAIKEAYGLDVADKQYAITSDNIHHIQKEHGDAKAEAARGQVAITREDIKSLSEILSGGMPPPNATIARSLRGNPEFLLESKLGGDKGRYHYAAEVIAGRGRLEVATLYKFKNRAMRDALLRAPHETSETTARVSAADPA